MTETSPWMKKVLGALDDDIDNLNAILDENTEADKVGQLNKLYDDTTVLHTAINTPECLKTLLRHGAKPSTADKNGIHPLHIAVKEDYLESVLVLCFHDADVNALSNDGMTPLQIAAAQISSACYDMLQFFGASMPDGVVNSLLKNEISKQNYWSITQGYKDKTIRNGGSTVKVNNNTFVLLDSFQAPIGLTIEKHQVDFHIFVSRMQLEYQSSFTRIPKVQIPDGAEQISDTFQYKVDRDLNCELYIDVKCSIKHLTSSRYKECIVQQVLDNDDDTTEEMYTNVEYISETQILVREFCLFATRSSPVIAFAVFVRNKRDNNILDSNVTVSSTQNPDFRLSVDSCSELNGQRVEMQVLQPVEDNMEAISDIDSGIGSTSSFLSIRTVDTPSSSRPQTAASTRSGVSTDSGIIVTLPIPIPNSNTTPNDQEYVMTSTQDDDNSWETHDDTKTEGKHITCHNAKPGNFIVVIASSITEFVKAKLSAMWEAVNGTKKSCKIFATVKPLDGTELYKFLVTVYLCVDDTDYSKKYEQLLKDNERLSENKKALKTSNLDIEINIKSTYTYHLDINFGKVEGGNKMPVQYQVGNDLSKKFKVTTEDKRKVSGLLKISKSLMSKTKKIPIEFERNKKKSITGNTFLNDLYVEENLADKISKKWFKFGIYIGSPFIKLEGYEDLDTLEACKKVLYQWRDDDQYKYPDGTIQIDKQLDRFIKATIDAEMPLIRNEFLENHVVHFYGSNKNLKNWIDLYRKPGTQRFDFTKLKPKIVSPLDDTFLVCVSEKMNVDEITLAAIRMDMSKVNVDEIKGMHISADGYIKCKLLSRIQDKTQGKKKKFLKSLMKYLKEENRMLIIQEITQCVKGWLDTDPVVHSNELSIGGIREVFKLK